jgi:6-phosphogluconolactonase/glucosamine-6-phosphate isomerase/deaminase
MPDMSELPQMSQGHWHNPEFEKQGNKDNNSEVKLKPKRDMSKVKCFNCGKRGHIAMNCPQKELDNKDKTFVSDEDDEAGSYVTYQVFNSMHPGQQFHD